MIKHTLTAMSLVFAFGLSASLSHATERVLFAFDDYSIPWQHNLKVTMVPAQKHPANPVLRHGPEGSPDYGHAALYGTVIKDGDKFRMWYLGMIQREVASNQATGYWRPMCYAESTDGINWTKPELGLVELNGDKRNNICLIEGEPFSLTRVNDFLSVLHEPNASDPAMRYKAAYIAHVPYPDIPGGMSNIGVKEKRICATICATSADGLSWKVVGDRPANAGGERFEASSLYRFGGFYYSTGQLLSPFSWRADGSDAGRVMLAYRSPDFKTWSKAKAFAFARPGQLTSIAVNGQQTHMGAGMWNRGNVLVGLYGMWQDGPKEKPKGASHLWGTRIDLGLILSNDGFHFREPVPDFKVVARGREGEWDSLVVNQANAFVNEGDLTMIWYSHWDIDVIVSDGKVNYQYPDIGLATLRRDGFGYLSRKENDNDAHFITSPLTVKKAAKIRLNIDDVTVEAPLTVELLDDRDRPLPGYSGAMAAQVVANGTGQDVVWPKARATNLPESQPFAVKVTFPVNSKARVFAVYVIE